MGSTESGTSDFSVGSIVWVRRRNGSWWPGKIVGPEELSASHLTSPRSGTPVKLLGREDASVDWYNLEKSKRVKAFRCGEFDDCIEKAESSQGMPIKKREKYARREDAILHALDLEKELLRKQGKTGITSDCADSRSSSGGVKGLVLSSETLCNDDLDVQNSKQNQLASRLDASHNNEIIGSPLSSQIFKEGNQLSGEEDLSEVIHQMRGLQDFGLRITPSMRKLSSSGPSNGSRKPTIDSNAQDLPHGDLKIGSISHINGNDSLDKRKRSHEGLSEEFLAKRHDKCRPLVQLLQSSAKLEVPDSLQHDSAIVSNSISGEKQMGVNCRAKRSKCLYLRTGSSEFMDYKAMSESDVDMSDSQIRAARHPDSLIVENITGFMDDESDTSETDSSESESDSSETEPEVDLLSDAAVPTEPGVSSLGRYELLDHQSRGSVEPNELALSGDTSHLYRHDHISATEAVSKWQLKGKRNIRNLNKRSLDEADGKTSIYGAYSKDKDFRTEIIGLDNGDSVTPRAALKGRNSFGCNMIDWDDWSWEESPAFTRYWETRKEDFTPVYAGRHQFGGRLRSILMDVDLKVQASYQKAPVPIVSLTSRLNGKAIIGHPIKIEALEDGSSSTLLSNVDYFGNETVENYGNASLPQAWRTARRTANFRVPRPHLTSSSLDGDESAYDLPFLDRESKLPFKKSNAGNYSHKAGVVRRNALQHTGISPYRKLQKASKKVSSSSSQKTRTLSSIPNEHNFSNKPIHVSSSRQNGLIKSESSGPTTVACIPIKLVFSRLLEKINRPPS